MPFRRRLRIAAALFAGVLMMAIAGCSIPQPSYAAWAETKYGISPNEPFPVETRTVSTNRAPEWGFTFFAGSLAETQRTVSFDFVTDDGEVHHLWVERERVTVRFSRDGSATGVLKFNTSPSNRWNTPSLDHKSLGYYVQQGLEEIVLTIPLAMDDVLRQP